MKGSANLSGQKIGPGRGVARKDSLLAKMDYLMAHPFGLGQIALMLTGLIFRQIR
jgi:hypothetical protein